MVTKSGTSGEALIDRAVDQPADSPIRRKRRVRVGRSQEKFPRWVRVLLWLGMPVVLWTGAFLIGRALL
jgi:hypothetical protein